MLIDSVNHGAQGDKKMKLSWTNDKGKRVKAQHLRNKYAGRCAICTETVDAEAGTLHLIWGKWSAQHIECPSVADQPLDTVGIQPESMDER